jgi:DNA-binding MarR family transcriptional regulator
MNSSIVPVITLWEEFLSKNNKADVKEFARWVLMNESNSHQIDSLTDTSMVIKNKPQGVESDLNESAKAMLLITRLHRFTQIKTKPIMKQLGFTKDHEYNMLIHIHLLKNPNKKQLAQNMLLETTTAVEISNRLLKKGLIKEIRDNGDKRSTRLGLTTMGEQKLYESYTYTKDFPELFFRSLTGDEITALVYLLQKVEKTESELLNN